MLKNLQEPYILDRMPEINPLAEAISTGGSIEKIANLLKQGSSPTANCSGPLKPLHLAAWHNRLDVINLLLAANTPVDQLSDDGRSPLFLAALYGAEDAIRLLRARGANINLQDEDGETPLHNACFAQCKLQQAIGTVKLLLSLGADPAIKNHAGQDALEEITQPPADLPVKSLVWRVGMTKLLNEALQQPDLAGLQMRIRPG